MGELNDKKNENLSDVAVNVLIEELFADEEKYKMREDEEIEESKQRLIFDVLSSKAKK